MKKEENPNKNQPLHFLIQYVKHLITATNQHGVHSPFVYNYITKCLYRKSYFKGSKSLKVLLKSIPYFSIERIKIISKDSQIKNRIQKEFDIYIIEESPFDLIFLANPQSDVLSRYQDEIHNDSAILIDNIHKSRASTALWETLVHKDVITVSIDMFHCGLLFFRQEQVKEHFKIRI